VVAGPTTVADEELVARVLDGDERAFAELYARHHSVIARRLRRVLGPRPEVEDVLQVTFVEAHKSLRRFDATRPFLGWLHGIAFRQAANHLRKNRRWRWFKSEVPAIEAVDQAASLEDQTIRRQLLDRLYRAMDDLPPKKRIAFSLHVLDGLGLTEIGEIVGASPQTVRARVLSARAEVLKHFHRAELKVPIDLEVREQLG
jgi:RNA polymerase sigma factor (sigma-70 family)